MIEIGANISLEKDTYQITAFIAEGAFGIVWEARRLSDKKAVAIKTIQTRRPDVHDRTPYSKEQKQRIREALEKEISLLGRFPPAAALENSILPMLDSGVHDEAPVLVLMRCDRPFTDVFKKRLEGEETLPFKAVELIRWTGQIATGLAALHASSPEKNKAVYRDLKFDNILMKGDRLFLSDFGTHKFLKGETTHSLGGTPGWAAPEMLIPKAVENGKPKYELTPAADLYCLGLILFALLTGGHPRSQEEILRRVDGRKNPTPGAERDFGKIGGIKDWERARLEKQIRKLFPEPDRTLIPERVIRLPDAQSIQKAMVSLVEDLLMPIADRRPTADKVIRAVGWLQDALQPQIIKLEIRLAGAEPIRVGKQTAIEIVAFGGRGLPEDGRWLNLSVGAKPVSADVWPKAPNTWLLRLPPFKNDGQHHIEVCVTVHGQVIRANRVITVEATPEQLWGKGRYADALGQSPNRNDWLDALETKANKNPGFRPEHLKILETVRGSHPEHVGINLRYWRLRDLIETDDSSTPQKKRKSRRPRAVNGLLFFCVVLALFIGTPFLASDYLSDKKNKKATIGNEESGNISKDQDESDRREYASEKEMQDQNEREKEAPLEAETATSASQQKPKANRQNEGNQALRILTIRQLENKETFKMGLEASGAIKDYATFTMTRPPRLVVNLRGRWQISGRRTFPMSDNLVRQVRIGEHPEYLAVVLDLKRIPSVPPEIEKNDNGFT
jgi:serine/threonine protein kinase